MRRAHGAGVGLEERPASEVDTVVVTSQPDARRPEPLRTEFAFELPRGYVDGAGNVHRSGVMRLATGRDELVPLRDAGPVHVPGPVDVAPGQLERELGA